MRVPKTKKHIMFDGKLLYCRLDSKHSETLGTITTRKGALTREQKLKAVANLGEWVEI